LLPPPVCLEFDTVAPPFVLALCFYFAFHSSFHSLFLRFVLGRSRYFLQWLLYFILIFSTLINAPVFFSLLSFSLRLFSFLSSPFLTLLFIFFLFLFLFSPVLAIQNEVDARVATFRLADKDAEIARLRAEVSKLCESEIESRLDSERKIAELSDQLQLASDTNAKENMRLVATLGDAVRQTASVRITLERTQKSAAKHQQELNAYITLAMCAVNIGDVEPFRDVGIEGEELERIKADPKAMTKVSKSRKERE